MEHVYMKTDDVEADVIKAKVVVLQDNEELFWLTVEEEGAVSLVGSPPV
jgi:hypothetical protein